MPSSSAAFVVYDNKKIIPAPFVSIEKVFDKTGDGRIIGSRFNITLNQQILPTKGSPNSSGEFYTGSSYPADEPGVDLFSSNLTKVEAMRRLFSNENEGKTLEVLLDCNGQSSLVCNPRINSIVFEDDGPWVDRIPYSISLEADVITGLSNPSGEDNFLDIYITEASESWNLEFNEQPENHLLQHTFRLNHQVSARGKRHYDDNGTLASESWEQAKSYCMSRLGYDSGIGPNSPLYIFSFNPYNHYRVFELNKDEGSYSVTEDFVLSSGGAIEDFTINSEFSATEPINAVSIEGSIQGQELLSYSGEAFTVVQTKYNAASGLWATVKPQLYTRAQTYAESLGANLNVNAQSWSVGKNPVLGSITYNYTYNTRPSNCVTDENVLQETISITENHPTDIFARLVVLGRQRGELLQDINTTTAPSRTLQVDLIVKATGACPKTTAGILQMMNPPYRSEVQDIVDAMGVQLSGLPSQVFKSNDSENFVPGGGSYSRTVTWTYSRCG